MLRSTHAFAWGDEGHEIIALVAEQYLEPLPRTKLVAMLAADKDNLTAHDIASEASRLRPRRLRGTLQAHPGSGISSTSSWTAPILIAPASDIARCPLTYRHRGAPAEACIVDKIDQFAAELSNPSTAADESAFRRNRLQRTTSFAQITRVNLRFSCRGSGNVLGSATVWAFWAFGS